MVHHFPSKDAGPRDPTFLVVNNTFFAKYKREHTQRLRNVFLTENVLIFVLRGVKHVHLGNETVVVSPDDVVFLRRGIYAMVEYFEADDCFEAVVMFLNTGVLRDVVRDLQIVGASKREIVPFLKIPANHIINAYKQQLLPYFTDRLLQDKDILLLKQREILLYLFKTVPLARTRPFWDSIVITSAESLAYVVEKHLFHRLTLNDYATLSNRSLSSFKRDFRRLYGAAPQRWMNQKRLQHAYTLLRTSNARIADISEQCGFENVAYFVRLFKRTYGQTPATFRAENNRK